MAPEYPDRGYDAPLPLPASMALRMRQARRGSLSLGDTREHYDPILEHPELREYTPVLAYYVRTGTLGAANGSRIVLTGEPLRPEPFVLRRITYATTGDVPNPSPASFFVPFLYGSQQGRVVQLRWGDDFTQFLGRDRALVSSVFADSHGYLDLPGLALFQGSQNLNVELERLDWPMPLAEGESPYNTDWDFVFHGFGLLPKGVNQSGSVGASDFNAEEFKDYTQVPSQYPVRVELGGAGGSQKAGSVQLRPAPFVCHRVTWATQADTLKYTGLPTVFGSAQGRSVRMRFGDPFTKFFGRTPGLISAVLGDSQGFLDLPRGIMLQGSQPIVVELERLFWPGADFASTPPTSSIFDFVFHGVDLLPQGVHQQGSAG